MSRVMNVTRRTFLKMGAGSAAFVLAAQAAPGGRLLDALTRSAHAGVRSEDAAFRPGVYVAIHEEGTVEIVCHRSEMGQGIRTGLPQVLADELEADWDRIRVVQADGDERYGDQNTDGSRSVRFYYETMRDAGATARHMLEQAAADHWGVDRERVRSENHEVVNTDSGERLGYGELAARAAELDVPDASEVRRKTDDEHRYIGQPVPIVDLHDMTHGTAEYGIDFKLPGMKYASIQRCPVFLGRVASFDDSEALAVRGVERVVELPAPDPDAPVMFQPLGGVAVVANNTWSAQQGRRKLSIEWDEGAHAVYDSEAYRQVLEETARKPGKTVRDKGDAPSLLSDAETVRSAEYYAPHQAQAPMEPPVAVARVENGECEVWAPTQHPQAAKQTLAAMLELEPEDVTVHVTLLGGGFGRKSKPDFIVEAALLAREVGAPVQVTWTREDDIRHGYFHSVSAQRLEAAVNDSGYPEAWRHRTVFPPIASLFEQTNHAQALELALGFLDMPFDIPNIRLENGEAKPHVRIGWLRSVANIYHAYANGCFVDELAHAAGEDPLTYWRNLIGEPRHIDLSAEGVENFWNYEGDIKDHPVDTGRLRAVLDHVAEHGEWGRDVADGHGLGIACHRSFLSYAAAIVEVAVDDDGRVHVPRVDIALDCGRIVNPDRVKAQMEGSVIYALCGALHSQVTAKDGRVVESNFDDYPIPRIGDTPEMRVHLMENTELPAGVGEPGVPPIAPALANAVFAATGKRIRELPITAERVQAAG